MTCSGSPISSPADLGLGTPMPRPETASDERLPAAATRRLDQADRLADPTTAMALHCTECGFVNAEGANYCQRCGALLPRDESTGEPATATYRIDETGELVPVEMDEVTAHGPALVIRAGGGRGGESFAGGLERT